MWTDQESAAPGTLAGANDMQCRFVAKMENDNSSMMFHVLGINTPWALIGYGQYGHSLGFQAKG
jgi:hypothetical protein